MLTKTSVIFLTLIVLTIVYLSVAKPDVIAMPRNAAESALLDEPETAPHHHPITRRRAQRQTLAVLALYIVGGFGFYTVRMNGINAAADAQPSALPAVSSSASAGATATTPANPVVTALGDMSKFDVIAQETLTMLQAGQQTQATAHITDLETAWDQAQAVLKHRDSKTWTVVDTQIDAVLRALRSSKPDVATEEKALTDLLTLDGAAAK